jgi:AraC-like DNA-binding protein
MRAGMSGFRVSTTMLRPMFAGLRQLGADVEAIVARAGLSMQDLQDPDLRIPIEHAIVLSAIAAESVQDEAFGLHLAELYRPGVFGVLDYLAYSSRTLHEALVYLCRYNRLLQDAAETLLEIEGDRVVIWQRVLPGVFLPAALAEHAMANLIVIGRALTGADLVPLEVHFTHAAPPYAAEHARIFKTAVTFGSTRDAIVLATRDLERPLSHADPNLCSILDRHARTLLEGLPHVPQFSSRVREIVALELKAGALNAERMASLLAMSTRTLQRRLKEENTTFEDLVDDLRKTLTARYLEDPQMSVEQVALLVGYSEASAFRRAFRRWYGTSPTTYRRKA